MKSDLDKLLKSGRVPERSLGYWEHFPKRVIRHLTATATRDPRHWGAWAMSLAGAGVLAGIFLFLPSRPPAPTPVAYGRLYREITALFPNQVQAIVVDEHGVKLELSETANVPRSQPLLVNACNPAGCRHVITFSGQQVKINGDTWDVLVNGQNEVVVAGRSTDRYQIEARTL
ncbi:MAG: hypothetical protein PCFJNLEI_00902 [Verrucomicrobiae bacterium]|nr:hypothetical protein [Verrucomicrobiae bacterium]